MPDRQTEIVDGDENFACLDCGQMKPRSSYHKAKSVSGHPPVVCKLCARQKASEENHNKLKHERRRRRQASAEIPPPPAEFEVPPARVAQGKRLACPHCHETALREPANGRPGFTTWLVTCAYCDRLNQLVEVAADGSARSIPRRAVDEPGTRKDSLPLGSGESFTNTNSAVFRPYCKVRGCGARAEEYGLCSPHLSRCRMDKRIADVDAWVAEISPPPKPAASQPSPQPRKNNLGAKKLPVTDCEVVDCTRPALAMGRRLCNTCYGRWKSRGRPEVETFIASPLPVMHAGGKRCRVEGCEKRSTCKQTLCGKHKMRWSGSGRPDVKAWLSAGAPTGTDWRKMQAPTPQPAAPAPPKPTQRRAPATPAVRNPIRSDEPCRARGCREPRLDRIPLCRKHEQRWMSSGRPEIEAWLVAGALRASDWHAMHKTEILPPDEQAAQVCKVSRCYRAAQCCSQSLCNACYQRWVWAEKPDLDFFFGIVPPRSHQERHVRTCKATGCSRVASSKESLCSMHQQRWNQCRRPHLEVWIAAGAMPPTRWREHLAAVAAELAGEAKCS